MISERLGYCGSVRREQRSKHPGVAFLPSLCFLGIVGRTQRAWSKAGPTPNDSDYDVLEDGCASSERAVVLYEPAR